MDNFDTSTRSGELDLPDKISLFETPGNIKPALNQKNLILVGAWACALFITSSISSVSNYNVSTTLSYPNKSTQSTVVYEPRIANSEELLDEEINSTIFVKTKPEKSYAVKLNIKQRNIGRPIIYETGEYES